MRVFVVGGETILRWTLGPHEQAPKTRGDGTWELIYNNEGQKRSLTFIAVDGVHVVNNERCVLTKWNWFDANRWTRGFPAHRNRRR
jgi:hypothetical protein